MSTLSLSSITSAPSRWRRRAGCWRPTRCSASARWFVIGLLRVFFFGKGSDYYFHSHAFMAKLSIFLALLSIVPTREFQSWRGALRAGQVPAVSAKKLEFVRRILHGELVAIVLILLCAAIMARGGWI